MDKNKKATAFFSKEVEGNRKGKKRVIPMHLESYMDFWDSLLSSKLKKKFEKKNTSGIH